MKRLEVLPTEEEVTKSLEKLKKFKEDRVKKAKKCMNLS